MQEPVTAPPLPDEIEASSLDARARQDLRGLAKDVAEAVARHLVAAGVLVDDDPVRALEHARYARRRASRIAVVREAAGITAYHAGEWAEALADLRAARRMGGGPGHLAVMADIERALGRPERAIEVARGSEAADLDRASQVELAMVVAGARRDLGELDASVVGLQIPELEAARRDPWSARLFYAYADNLLAAGRESDAMQWFVHAVDADELGETDAAYRLADLTGEPPPEDDGIDFDVEEDEYVPDVAGDPTESGTTAPEAPRDAPAVVATGPGPDAVEAAGSSAGPDIETDDDVIPAAAGAAAAAGPPGVGDGVDGPAPSSAGGAAGAPLPDAADPPATSAEVDAEVDDGAGDAVGGAIVTEQGTDHEAAAATTGAVAAAPDATGDGTAVPAGPVADTAAPRPETGARPVTTVDGDEQESGASGASDVGGADER